MNHGGQRSTCGRKRKPQIERERERGRENAKRERLPSVEGGGEIGGEMVASGLREKDEIDRPRERERERERHELEREKNERRNSVKEKKSKKRKEEP